MCSFLLPLWRGTFFFLLADLALVCNFGALPYFLLFFYGLLIESVRPHAKTTERQTRAKEKLYKFLDEQRSATLLVCMNHGRVFFLRIQLLKRIHLHALSCQSWCVCVCVLAVVRFPRLSHYLAHSMSCAARSVFFSSFHFPHFLLRRIWPNTA